MELTDDPATSDKAAAHWVKYVMIGILVGSPILFAALYLSLSAAGVDKDQVWIVSLWGALWTGVFAGGTVGAMVYAVRNDH